MPTSGPGVLKTRHPPRDELGTGPSARARSASARGFTLVELLVVMLVLGVATALISVRLLESPQQRSEKAVETLGAALEHAALTAQWQGRNLLWRADQTGWRFLRQTTGSEGEQWSAVEDEPQLAARPFPAELRPMAFRRAGQASAELALIFSAHGISDPFELRLAMAEQVWQVSGNALGRVRVESIP